MKVYKSTSNTFERTSIIYINTLILEVRPILFSIFAVRRVIFGAQDNGQWSSAARTRKPFEVHFTESVFGRRFNDENYIHEMFFASIFFLKCRKRNCETAKRKVVATLGDGAKKKRFRYFTFVFYFISFHCPNGCCSAALLRQYHQFSLCARALDIFRCSKCFYMYDRRATITDFIYNTL